MRSVIIFFACLFFSVPVSAEELQPGDVGFGHSTKNHHAYKRLYQEVNGQALEPGDKGYRSEEFLGTYKKIYDGGKCICKSGYCRPTGLRLTQYGSPTGYDILIDREWYPVPLDAMQNEHTLSRELMRELFSDGTQAHVCAYPSDSSPRGQRIECAAWITGG